MRPRCVLSQQAGRVAHRSFRAAALQPQPKVAAAGAAANCLALQLSRRGFATGFGGGFGGFPGGFGGPPGQGNSDRYYELLGVPRDADERAIKRAYKEKAMKHHPDRGGDENKFKEISKAYEVLSNPDKRQVYDAYGEEGLENLEQGGGGAGPSVDPLEMFSQMFGFNVGGGPRGQPRTRDSVHELQVSLEELYQGTTKEVVFNRNVLCGTCKGYGGHDARTCSRCKGTGKVLHYITQGPLMQYRETTCDSCGGRGFTIPKGSECKDCSGKGHSRVRQPFRIDIPAGMQDGGEYRYRGMSDEALGHDTGDVAIIIRTKSHPTFHRRPEEPEALYIAHKISLMEALCGFQFSTTFLDGKEVTIRSHDQPMRPGDFLRVPGKGMPRADGSQQFGDLFVSLEVDFPSTIDDATKEKLADALGGSLLPKDVRPGTVVGKRVDAKEHFQGQQRRRGARQGGHGGGGAQQCHVQ